LILPFQGRKEKAALFDLDDSACTPLALPPPERGRIKVGVC